MSTTFVSPVTSSTVEEVGRHPPPLPCPKSTRADAVSGSGQEKADASIVTSPSGVSDPVPAAIPRHLRSARTPSSPSPCRRVQRRGRPRRGCRAPSSRSRCQRTQPPGPAAPGRGGRRRAASRRRGRRHPPTSRAGDLTPSPAPAACLRRRRTSLPDATRSSVTTPSQFRRIRGDLAGPEAPGRS